jgi:hypothetical protein
MRPDSSYHLEEPIENVDRIYEVPARSYEIQSQRPSPAPEFFVERPSPAPEFIMERPSPAPEIIVERPELAHTPSHTSEQASSKYRPTAALQIAPEDLQLDHAITSARRRRRGLGSVFRALIDGLGLIFNRLSLVCSRYFIK